MPTDVSSEGCEGLVTMSAAGEYCGPDTFRSYEDCDTFSVWGKGTRRGIRASRPWLRQSVRAVSKRVVHRIKFVTGYRGWQRCDNGKLAGRKRYTYL